MSPSIQCAWKNCPADVLASLFIPSISQWKIVTAWCNLEWKWVSAKGTSGSMKFLQRDSDMPPKLTAAAFLKRLKALQSPTVAKSHAHLAADKDDIILGVRMGQVFSMAKEHVNMELDEVEAMLESPIHEMRVGAVSIMDFQARSKKTMNERRKELFDLYIRRHDRINT